MVISIVKKNEMNYRISSFQNILYLYVIYQNLKMSTCPIVRKKDLSKVDEIMKSIKVKLQKDGLIQSSGGKSRRRKRHGGQERQNITLLLCKAVVLFHEIYEKFQDYTCLFFL